MLVRHDKARHGKVVARILSIQMISPKLSLASKPATHISIAVRLLRGHGNDFSRSRQDHEVHHFFRKQPTICRINPSESREHHQTTVSRFECPSESDIRCSPRPAPMSSTQGSVRGSSRPIGVIILTARKCRFSAPTAIAVRDQGLTVMS